MKLLAIIALLGLTAVNGVTARALVRAEPSNHPVEARTPEPLHPSTPINALNKRDDSINTLENKRHTDYDHLINSRDDLHHHKAVSPRFFGQIKKILGGGGRKRHEAADPELSPRFFLQIKKPFTGGKREVTDPEVSPRFFGQIKKTLGGKRDVEHQVSPRFFLQIKKPFGGGKREADAEAEAEAGEEVV